MRMKILTRVAMAAILSTSAPALADSRQDWATVSDIGVTALSLAAIGVPIAKGDKQGALQAAGSIGASLVITNGLKEVFPELRPDRSDRKSFPSSHSSTAFAAAATLFNREGPKVGIPAMAVATLVGVARVKADKHHWYDVVVGAAIGSGSGFLITRDRPSPRIAILPWGDTSGGGVTVAARF
jgi:membrane-associated phospholipid phosphatase